MLSYPYAELRMGANCGDRHLRQDSLVSTIKQICTSIWKKDTHNVVGQRKENGQIVNAGLSFSAAGYHNAPALAVGKLYPRDAHKSGDGQAIGQAAEVGVSCDEWYRM
eukprot:1153316-Pelagomonas_calceolata.AAC.12